MNSDVPPADEILDCYNEKCAEQTCDNCKLSLGTSSDSTNECAIRYTIAILTGEMELGDSLRKEPPPPAPNLPSWCKPGAWVTNSCSNKDGMITPWRIEYISGNKAQIVNRGLKPLVPVKDLKPIRFRPYTFEDAEKLFLKTIQFTRTSRRRRGAEVVTSVIEGDDGLWINGATFSIWTSYHATIDDIPVGVPEVDEKALKKALKEVNHE